MEADIFDHIDRILARAHQILQKSVAKKSAGLWVIQMGTGNCLSLNSPGFHYVVKAK